MNKYEIEARNMSILSRYILKTQVVFLQSLLAFV